MRWITNFSDLSISPQRKLVLKLAEKAYEAINTESVVYNQVKLIKQTLKIQNKKFDLNEYERIFVLGFGKASPKAALAIEDILKDKIADGAVIGVTEISSKRIKSFVGTHPLPSLKNVEAAKTMSSIVNSITEKDLIITLISGGGSALLCWDEEEFNQGTMLYENILKTGENIQTLNIVRKHLSKVKGGGLAKMLYPATVISLIFSDVPGDDFASVASGPTYYDHSTMYEAKAIIDKHSLGEFKLYETPKEQKYFTNVYNFPVISNKIALNSMSKTCEEFGLNFKILSASMYDDPETLLKKLQLASKKKTVILAGGEAKIVVTKSGGSGGRCEYLGMKALDFLKEGEIFVALASDGHDNSDCGGVVVDLSTKKRAKNLGLEYQKYLESFDGYNFFDKLGSEQIFTGNTDANIADLFIWYKD